MAEKATYTFHWTKPGASEVWVSGDFDDWKKSVQLEKKGEIFEKTIELVSQKHLYKFIVDGNWIIDDSKAFEADQNGVQNNILQPSDLTPLAAAAVISTVGPEATTVAMAGEVPKEEPATVPGSFPETPGEVSVNPIPATSGIGNPVTLAPGEKVPDPSTLTGNTVESTVTTDKESYEKADGAVAGVIKDAEAAVPPVGGTFIPESSLPMGEGAVATPVIQSSGAGSTTADLVANIPKEPEKPATIVGAVTGAAAAVVATATAAVVATKDKAVETAAPVVASVTDATKTAAEKTTETAAAVPTVVSDSIKKAGESAEAAANPEAVAEKKDVEAELKKEVPVTDKTGEPAPVASAPEVETPAAAETPAAPVTDKKSKRQSLLKRIKIKFDKFKNS